MQIVLARVGAAAAMAYGARAARRALEPTGDECLRSSAEATRELASVLLPLGSATEPHSCTEQLNCVCLLQDTL